MKHSLLPRFLLAAVLAANFAFVTLAHAKLTTGAATGEQASLGSVNGQAITMADLFRVLQQSGQTEYLRQAMRSVVIEALYLQEAQKAGIKPTDITEEEIQGRLSNRINMVREKLGEPAAARLTKLLDDPANKNRLYEDTRRQILVDKVFQSRREEVAKLVEVTAAEIDNFVQKLGNEVVGLHLNHLVVKDLKTAKAAIAEIKKGKTFESMVEKYGSKENKERNGDIGWQSLDDMGPLYDYHLKDLKDGQVSEPVKREDGKYSVIKVLAHRLAKDNPEVLITTAKKTIGAQKAMSAMEEWSKKLVEQADIQLLYAPMAFPVNGK